MSRECTLVTDASRGIGRAITERLIADGMHVINIDKESPAKIAAHESFYQVGISDEKALRTALAKINHSHTITRLVNNAGIVRPANIENTSLEDLHAAMNVNIAAAIICAQAVLPAMKAAHFDRIVNISSRAALGKEERIVLCDHQSWITRTHSHSSSRARSKWNNRERNWPRTDCNRTFSKKRKPARCSSNSTYP